MLPRWWTVVFLGLSTTRWISMPHTLRHCIHAVTLSAYYKDVTGEDGDVGRGWICWILKGQMDENSSTSETWIKYGVGMQCLGHCDCSLPLRKRPIVPLSYPWASTTRRKVDSNLGNSGFLLSHDFTLDQVTSVGEESLMRLESMRLESKLTSCYLLPPGLPGRDSLFRQWTSLKRHLHS